MKMTTLKLVYLACTFVILYISFISEATAQTTLTRSDSILHNADHTYKPLQINFSEDGTKQLRFIMWHQFWARYTENNPGTLDAALNPQQSNMDFGLRRSRFLVVAQVSSRFLALVHFGINNQRFNGGGLGADGKKPQLFIHDAWTEYTVIPKALSIGAGLHYWLGISRLTNGSTLTFMTLDAPIFNWPLIERTDQFARQMGVYAKGQLGRLDYRVAVNNPFTFGLHEKDVKSPEAFEIINEKAAYSGYFFWQFWDKESNKLPFAVGTYMGAKKILNVGFGFHHHNNATASSIDNGETVRKHAISLFGTDIFCELPVNKDKSTAISLYSVGYKYDFGPGYLRNIGIMNAAGGMNGGGMFNGPGNNQPTIGTGSIVYTQLGYALPKFNQGNQFMPYVTHTYKNFEALNEASHQFDLGLNYFINGHNAKITLQYSRRPVYDNNRNWATNKGEIILQSHIFL